MTGRHRVNDDASSSWKANRFRIRRNNATVMPSHRERYGFRSIQHYSIGPGRSRRVNNNSRLERKLNAVRKLNSISNFLSKTKTKFWLFSFSQWPKSMNWKKCKKEVNDVLVCVCNLKFIICDDFRSWRSRSWSHPKDARSREVEEAPERRRIEAWSSGKKKTGKKPYSVKILKK